MYNATANVGWQDSPPYRSTWSILQSCFTTLIICVYSALHLPVPNPSYGYWKRRFRVAKWVVGGIFAPEYLAMEAVSNWVDVARADQYLPHTRLKSINEDTLLATYSELPSHDPADDYVWTATHNQFLTMKGLCVLQVDNGREVVRTVELFDSPETLSQLHHMGLMRYILPIREDEIKDKSKGQPLAKALACLQLTYLLLTTIIRVSIGLAIAELEFTTILHALMALVAYGFWWSRPQNIETPYVVRDSIGKALLHVANKEVSTRLRIWLQDKTGADLNLAIESWSIHEYDPKTVNLPRSTPTQVSEQSSDHSDSSDSSAEEQTACSDPPLPITSHERRCIYLATPIPALMPEQRSALAVLLRLSGQPTTITTPEVWPQNLHADGQVEPAILWLDDRDIVAFGEVFKLLTDRGMTQLLIRLREQFIDVIPHPSIAHRLAHSIWNTNSPEAKEDAFNCILAVGATAIYGALCLSLWDYPFPTVIERQLWLISSCVLALSGALLPPLGVWWIGRNRSFYFDVSALIVLGAFLVANVTCRLYLIIASIVSIRSLPASAYRNIGWTEYIPHL